MEEYTVYDLNGLQLIYMLDEESRHMSMVLLPRGSGHIFNQRRMWLDSEGQTRAWEVGSLCHLALRQHPQGNGAGGTLKYGESTQRLRFVNQKKEEDTTCIKITTELAADTYAVYHIVTYTKGEMGVEVESIFQNRCQNTMTLDMFTSFSLDNLSPLQKADGAYALYLHRFHGGWSREGKHQEDSAERLNLGSTWTRAFPESERYGAVGSYPVKRWFPFGCVEDRQAGIFWAVQLAVNSSWQMEFSRDGDCCSLSGGLGDCETSAWWKEVKSGELFHAPKAYISVGGNLETVCQNITGMFQKYADTQPSREQELPIWFNEWCSSWGHPTHDSILSVKESLRGLPIAGIVIDAGWSKQPVDVEPQAGNGDWEYDSTQFPLGLKPVSEELKKENMDLGIWMEFEVTTTGAKVHQKEWDSLHLKRNGELIQTGWMRRFWDFRKPEVTAYLKEKVIEFIRENEIRYLKVDYNGSIGVGCDGAESPGEGLRLQMQAVYAFFTYIREELPELVIENCASGGHRLEPLMMSVTSVSSFSDAHECREIPYIAANLHNLILPRQSLIWAVIRPDLTETEIYYRMISTLLGRMCLSGDIGNLNQSQKRILTEGCSFYQRCKEVIKNGTSSMIRNCTENPHQLQGWQALCRRTQKEMLIIFHSFEAVDGKISIGLPEGQWQVVKEYGAGIEAAVDAERLTIRNTDEWMAYAVLLERKSC